MVTKFWIVGLVLGLNLGPLKLNTPSIEYSQNSSSKTFYHTHEENPFQNLHQITRNFYRSEQATKIGMVYLKEQGFKTIINLREKQKDVKLAGDLDFTFIHYPIVTWRLDETDILNVMGIVKSAKGKVLIHCKHGSDRTGCMVAAYRIIFENWSKEKALQELRKDELGYNEFWFPGIAELIENLDVKKMKVQLGLSH